MCILPGHATQAKAGLSGTLAEVGRTKPMCTWQIRRGLGPGILHGSWFVLYDICSDFLKSSVGRWRLCNFGMGLLHSIIAILIRMRHRNHVEIINPGVNRRESPFLSICEYFCCISFQYPVWCQQSGCNKVTAIFLEAIKFDNCQTWVWTSFLDS